MKLGDLRESHIRELHAAMRNISRAAAVLESWQESQLFERLEWADGWTDSGRVFTRDDGSPLREEWISVRFAALAAKASLPPIRFHDLRHGSALLLSGQGSTSKWSARPLGMRPPRSPPMSTPSCSMRWPRPPSRRSRPSFPARARFESAMSQQEPKMITETKPATTPFRHSGWSNAEARGFEPRMGVNPNRISSAAP